MTFPDHFSAVAAGYAAFRPRYPAALFEYLATLTTRHDLALDCATGNGQAAAGLSAHYAHVVATDASAAQVSQAEPHERIEYRVAPAEASGLPDASVDLVTAAQALHWLDRPRFFAEAGRVLVPDGAIAVWGYDAPVVDDRNLNEPITRFYSVTVGPFWPPERAIVEDHYRSIAFPFDEIRTPSFEMTLDATLGSFCGYVRTWSAVRQYQKAHDTDPVVELERALRPHWPEGQAVMVRWPVFVRAGRR